MSQKSKTIDPTSKQLAAQVAQVKSGSAEAIPAKFSQPANSKDITHSNKLEKSVAKNKNEVNEEDIDLSADSGAESAADPIVLAQAEAATATDAAAAGSSSSAAGAAGAEAGAAAGSGAAAGAAAGTAAMSGGMLAMIGVGVVAVAAASSGGAAAAAAAPVTGFAISGVIALGKITDVTGLAVEAYKADGTALLTTSSVVNADGTYRINVGEDYTGAILVRLKDTNSTTNYFDEGTGAAKDIATDLRAVVYATAGNGTTVTVMLTPLTELAVRQLVGDSGGDAGASVTTLGVSVAAVTSTLVSDANNAVKTAFGLAGDIVATIPVTVDNLTGTVNDYGQALAAISGLEAVQSVDTSQILNQLSLAIVTPTTGASALSQSAVDMLVQGAQQVQAAALATPANYATNTATTLVTALTTAIGTSVNGLTLTVDTGAMDFITSSTAAHTISGTLGATLGTNKLWGSVDNGATWTDITTSVAGTTLTWAVGALTGTNVIKLAQTASTVTNFTGATADLIANTDVVMQNYAVDTAAPAAPSVAVVAGAADATAAEATTGAVTVNAEKLSSVAVTFTGTAGSVTKTITGSGAAQAVALTAGNLTTLGEGAVGVSAVATDIAGNASAAGTGSFNLDTVLPSFSSATAANFAENTDATTVAYTAAAADANTVTYSLGGTDAALFNIATATGAVTFKASPNFEAPVDAGANNVYDLTVTATDVAGNANSQAVAITVTNVNEIPSLTSGAAVSFAENGTGTAYTVTATDPDAGTTLTYALGGTDAALFSINSSTGAVTFATSPNFEAPGSAASSNVYNITVTASDGTLTTAAQAVAITVTNVNEAPALTSGATSTATLAVNQAFSDDVSNLFSDVDAGNVFSYTATGLPTGITLNSTSGVISGTPTATGTADIVLTATDSGGLTASHTVTVNVVTAPVITGIASNVTQAKSGDALTFTATISEAVTVAGTPTLTLDVGGTPVTATYAGGTGTAALTFTATTPAGDDATVTVTAINLNGGSVTGNVTTQPLVTTTTGQVVTAFIVDNSNPVFTSAVTANAAENQTAAYTSATTDGTAVTYTLGGTDASLFNISAGAVTFIASPNFEIPTDSGPNNVYDVTITATDALSHVTSQNVAITVTDANDAPTLTSGATSTTTLAVNQAFSNDASGLFNDVDAGNVFSYTATGLPTGITLNSTSGVISGTPTATGTADIVLTATDSGGLTASHTVTVNVVTAPTITSTIDNVTNFEVTSNIVMTASENVTAVAGKYIHIINDANDATYAGFHGEATDNSQHNILVTSAAVTITNNTITINPGFDLDFSNNYHITVDAGAFLGVTSGQGSVATADATVMNFSTVLPSASATATASQAMASGTDAMVAGHSWWDAEGVGTAGNYPGAGMDTPTAGQGNYSTTAVARDFVGGDYALAFTDYGVAGIQTNDFSVLVNNFAAGDLIYTDNKGDNVGHIPAVRQGDFNGGIITDNGAAPTYFSFGTIGATPNVNGGELFVTVAGSTASFADTMALQVLLNVTYQPVLYG